MQNSIRQLISKVTANYRPRVAQTLRKRISRGSKRTLKHHTWSPYDNIFNLREIMNTSDNNVFLGTSDFDDLITSQILKKRIESNKRTVHRETTVHCNREKWSSWSEQNFKEYLFVQGSSSSGFIIEQSTNNYITYNVNSNSTTVRAFGDVEFAEDVIKIVESEFDVVTSYIEWVYGGDGNSVNVPLNRARLPIKEMYPFLGGETLEEYYDRYMDSNANILLLIGPPGTGKTTFIRGLLAHRNASAIVTYDSAILDKDTFFARFIEDDAEVMVLEDSDAFLKSRSDGNTMMHRFLNVGDGLVTTKGKKMIFSTNLPSIRDIDTALVRPGRCFDIVTFGEMNKKEAQQLADKLGVELIEGKEQYTIAEVFNRQSEQAKVAKTNRKVGFI